MSTEHDANRTHEVHRDADRFFVAEDDALGELVYTETPERLTLVHVGVPDTLAGRGIGSALVTAAVAYAVEHDLVVVPWCPFARAWLREHHDVASTLTIDWTHRPTSKEPAP